MRYRTANREDGARLDVVAQGLWGKDRQCTFFDVRVFNPFAQSHQKTSLTQCYHRQEQEKRRHYEERVREIEHGSFSPLVFATPDWRHGSHGHSCVQKDCITHC